MAVVVVLFLLFVVPVVVMYVRLHSFFVGGAVVKVLCLRSSVARSSLPLPPVLLSGVVVPAAFYWMFAEGMMKMSEAIFDFLALTRGRR